MQTGDSHDHDSFADLHLCPRCYPALAVVAGSDTPSPKPQHEEAKSQAENTVQTPPAACVFSAWATATDERGEGRGLAPQSGRIEYSYPPLKGDQERSKSVKALQQLTVDLLALHNMYKVAHWDLTGPLYVPLHEYFQQQADFYLQQADLFAERVLHLGASVDGRFSTIASTTKLAEMPDGYLTDDHSLKLLLDRVTVLQKEIYDLIVETEASDPPSSNKLQDPGVLGGQEPVAVTGPPAKAEFAPGRSTLGSVSGKRTFGPLSIVHSTIATPTTVARVSPLRKARRCTKEDPHRLTPHIGRPLLWRAGHHGTTLPGPFAQRAGPHRNRPHCAPLSRGRTPDLSS